MVEQLVFRGWGWAFVPFRMSWGWKSQKIAVHPPEDNFWNSPYSIPLERQRAAHSREADSRRYHARASSVALAFSAAMSAWSKLQSRQQQDKPESSSLTVASRRVVLGNCILAARVLDT